MTLAAWDEKRYYTFLREASKSDPNVQMYKHHGNIYSSGLPDIMMATPQGTFNIELKCIDMPYRTETSYEVRALCTDLQWNVLHTIWRINGMAALAVGFQYGSNRYIAVLPPKDKAVWTPHMGLNHCLYWSVYHDGASKFDIRMLTEKLVGIVKDRYQVS